MPSPAGEPVASDVEFAEQTSRGPRVNVCEANLKLSIAKHVDEELVCVKNYSSVTRRARATFPDKGRLLKISPAPLFGFSSGEAVTVR